MPKDPIVIISALRTPTGAFQGNLQSLSASELGAVAIKGVLDQTNLDINSIDEVLMGCVLSAGQGQAPARQAALKAGLSSNTACTTINKMCGSGMKSVMLGYDMLKAESANIVIAGGMESMTNAPYLLPNARAGYRMGHQKVMDHMFLDGLEDAYEVGRLMGSFAEDCAKSYGFSREHQDTFAINSIKKAQKATEEGAFLDEILPIIVKNKTGETKVDQDEGPTTAKIEKIPHLKPAFAVDGTVTAANSSSISDGAAVLLLMRESEAKAKGLEPLAKIIASSTHAQTPAKFTTAPIDAIKKLISSINWSLDEVDLFEINEAFAVVTMAAMQSLALPPEKVNVHGGACVLGHPIGASGARILVTLIHALKRRNLTKGIAALCIGGGEATAMAVEV